MKDVNPYIKNKSKVITPISIFVQGIVRRVLLGTNLPPIIDTVSDTSVLTQKKLVPQATEYWPLKILIQSTTQKCGDDMNP